MKKVLIAFAVIVLVAISVPVIGGIMSSVNPSKSIEMAQNKKVSSSPISTYYNPARGIKFAFPDGWTQDDRLIDGPKPLIGRFYKETASVQLGHFSKADSEYMNFTDLKKGMLKQLAFTPGFTLISESDTTVNDLMVYKLVTTIEDQNKNTIKNMIYLYFPTDGDMFVSLTYTNQPENFDTFAKEFEAIASSMAVLTPSK